jgi:hypothetical protein
MFCLELQELESRHNRYNELSLSTRTLLAEGRGEFSKWHRAGRARLAFDIQMHRQHCDICRSLNSQQAEHETEPQRSRSTI